MFRAMQNPLQNMQQTQQLAQQNQGMANGFAAMDKARAAQHAMSGQWNGNVLPPKNQAPAMNAMPQFDPNSAAMPVFRGAGQQNQMGPVQQSGFGYQVNPGNNGFFEQQTPVGSFAGAQQQQANATGMFNPYIGQTSGQIAGAGPVNAATAATSNPYLGQQTQQVNYQGAQSAGQNAFAGSNPYLTQAIDAGAQDVIRNYQMSIAPQRDRAEAMSGNFGNTGTQQFRLEDQRNLGQTLANQANSMRMQDYTQQQGLAENALNRQQGLNQFNAGNQFQANMANAGFNAGDLSRNLGATTQLGMFNAGQLNNMGQFNAGLNQGTQQFNAGLGQADLTRNANLAQNMGQFNAGAANQASMFNAGQGNAMNQFNAGSANQMLGQMRNLNQNQRQFDSTFGENQRQFNANFGEGQRRYDEGMDFNTWQANNNLQRQGVFDQLNVMGQLAGLNQMGLQTGNQQQQIPINQWLQFMQAANQAGGLGGSSPQTFFGNPFLGFLGGAQMGGSLFGG
jgi:hypothetical protein